LGGKYILKGMTAFIVVAERAENQGEKMCQSPIKNSVIFKRLEQARQTVPGFLSDFALAKFAHLPRWAEAI